MFIKKSDKEFILAQVYVDDIIFWRQTQSLITSFVKQMKTEFEISMVGELSFSIGF